MSAIPAINKALYQRLIADLQLAALLTGRKVYSGMADGYPSGAYIVLGSDSEIREGALGQTGYRDETEVRIFMPTPEGQPVSKLMALTIYEHTARILDGVPFDLPGFKVRTPRLSLPLVAIEPAGRTVMLPAIYSAHVFTVPPPELELPPGGGTPEEPIEL